MSADPFHLNRPVHLARRDVFYEKAAICIKKLPEQKLPAEQRKTAEQALYLLKEALCHAEAANLSEKTSTQNRLFVDFLNIAVDNTQSVVCALRRQVDVDAPNSSLDKFLGSGNTGAKMSIHFRRCGARILKGLLDLLQLAEKPYRDLQRTSLAKMTVADKIRYEKAYKHFEEQADDEVSKAVEQTIS